MQGILFVRGSLGNSQLPAGAAHAASFAVTPGVFDPAFVKLFRKAVKFPFFRFPQNMAFKEHALYRIPGDQVYYYVKALRKALKFLDVLTPGIDAP
jgi:hypothetical protein